jgi:curved DNA-binding protein CbpA
MGVFCSSYVSLVSPFLVSVVLILRQYHPDKQSTLEKGDERLIRLTEAYRVLMDPEARESYEVLDYALVFPRVTAFRQRAHSRLRKTLLAH